VLTLLLLALAWNQVAWAVVAHALADGSHEVSLQGVEAGTSIVLGHGSAGDARARNGGEGADGCRTAPVHHHGAVDHPDHVIEVSSAGWFVRTTTTALERPSGHASCLPLASVAAAGSPGIARVACAARVGPPPAPPSRTSILQI
jgi:hypothetical protein